MRSSLLALPGTAGRVVERALVWTVVVATIAWSVGISFLIKVPFAHAAVTVAEQPNTNAMDFQQFIRNDEVISFPRHFVSWTMSANASETLNSVAYTIQEVTATVQNDEIAAVLLYGPNSACTGAVSIMDPALFLCGTDTTITVGSADSITVDNNGDTAGGGPATIGATAARWALAFQASPSGNILDNNDAFRVALATNALTASANSPTFAAAFTSDTFTFTTAAADGAPPTSSAGGPPDGMISAPSDAIVDRLFNEALTPSRVNSSNVTLKQCTATGSSTTSAAAATTECASVGANVCGTLDLVESSTRIRCTPASSLALDKWHEFRINTKIMDASGNSITALVYRFKTGSSGSATGGNLTGPNIVHQTPQPGQMDVSINANLTASFSLGPESNMKADGSANAINNAANVSVKPVTQTTSGPTLGSEVCTNGTVCVLTWDATARILTVNPASNLTAGTEYDFCIRSTAQNQSNVGLMGDRCVHFRTSTGAADTTAPTLRAASPTVPANGATSVSPFNEIRVAFSKDIDQSTLSLSTVRLCADSTAGTAGCEGGDTRLTTTANFGTRYDTFDHAFLVSPIAANALAANTRYCIEVVGGGSGVKDAVGNTFAATSSTTTCFTTGAATDAFAGAPKVLFADCDNNKCVIHFSEPMRASDLVSGGNVVNANVALATIVSGVTTSVNLSGKTAIYRPDFRELEIQNLGLTTDQQVRLTVTTAQDLAANAIDTANSNNIANSKVLSSVATGGNLGTGAGTMDFQSGTNFATFWEKPQRCQPRANATSKVTTLECEFSAPAALPIGSTFTLSFPSGFTMTDGTNNTRAVPVAQSFMNADINGPAANAVTIASVTPDNVGKTAIVATGGGAIASGDMLRFELDRLTTPATPGNDLRISVIVKDDTGVKVGSTISPAPFTIAEAGALAISGKVCKGTTSGGACGGGDTGIANKKIFCDQFGGFTTTLGGSSAFMGHQEATTDGTGAWSITGLVDGQYGCSLPPDPTAMADTGGAPPFQQITLAGASKTGVDFKYTDLSVTGKTLTINVNGLNDADSDADDFDVFCHAGFSSFEFSAPVMKAVDAATSGTTTATMKLQGGKTYECGIGPHMAFEQFSNGAPPPPPTFTFMPPKPVQVVVPAASDPAAVTFNIQSTNRTITGTVVDGSATGIANVFVHAAPVGCFDATSGEAKECFGSFAQSKSDGTFTLNVADGTYEVGADGPGLPQSTKEIATANGANVTGITLKMVKSSTTISGQVLDESGNGIKYAHVNGERRTITSGTDACDFSNSRPAGGWADSPTDENGNFTLYAAAGTWCVHAFAPAYGEVGTKTVTISGTTSQSGQNIQATSTNYGTISGTVTKGGTATGGGFVNCFAPGTGGNGASTNSDGTYRLKVKLPSSGTVTYTCDGFLPGVGPLGRQTTTLGVGTTTATVNFTVGNPGTITVTIANITDAFCDVRDVNGLGAPAGKPSSTGAYTINVPAGTYTVRCGGPKYGELVNQTNVTVTAGGTATVTGTAPTTRTVTGRVTDGTSNVAGATLTFTDTSGKSFMTTTGAQSGTNTNLSLAGVPEGTYTLTASKRSFEPVSTTATVSSGNLTLSSPIALAPMAGSAGDDVKIRIQESATNYTGDAKVICTKDGKTVVADIDETTGIATPELTNGTWTVKAIGDNGKESSSTTITVSSGDYVGAENANYDKTLSLANTISGYTQKSESATVGLSSGGLLKYQNLAVGSGTSAKTPEINVPASTLSTSDSSTGKVEMKSDPTLKDIDPGANTNFVGSYGYEITPKDANGNPITSNLSGSVTVTIPYTDADVSTAGVDESELKFASFNTTSQTWETFPTTVDTTNNLLIAQVSHFSSFGIIGTEGGGSPSAATDTTPPAAPGSIAATGTASAVTITWTDPTDSDFDSVEVLRSNPPSTAVSGTPLSRVAKGTKRYVDSAVTPNTAYTYVLRVRDTAGNTRNSGTISVTTPAATAAAPTTGTVTAPPTTTITAPPAVTTPTAAAPTAPGLTAIGLSAGDVVQAPGTKAVYLVGADGKRYVYPNEVTFRSWHKDFTGTKKITNTQLATLPLGGVVTMRPGTWLVKIESDPKVYAVEPGGALRWVETEERARTLYGSDWNRQIVDVPVSYWVNYRAGGQIGKETSHPTGTLVRTGSQTYYIEGGRKRSVSRATFDALGFQDRFVRALSSSLVYEEGPALTSNGNALRFASQ